MGKPTFERLAGAVIAGGLSRRMGADKGLIPWRGKPLVTYPLGLLSGLFEEVIIITRNTEAYRRFGYPVHADLFEYRAAMVGLYSGLSAVSKPMALMTACDMPLISEAMVRFLAAEAAKGAWAVVPATPAGPEPLLAVYDKRCLPAMEKLIRAGDLRIASLLSSVPSRLVSAEETGRIDPHYLSFVNLNTPEELARAETLTGKE